MLYWGGVQRGNEQKLRALGDEALPTLMSATRLLDPEVADLSEFHGVRHMNSGFSKIYALMLGGFRFPIYDSRVACALGSLVRLYCEDSGLMSVPPVLAFGIPASRGSVSRDPSSPPLVFPKLWAGQRQRYASSNVRAAWLLDPLSEEQPFAELGKQRRLLALQSAMFMIGYAPLARAGTS